LQTGKIFGLVHAQAAILKTAVSALNKTTFYTTNPSVFGKADFTALQLSVNQLRNLPSDSDAFQLQTVCLRRNSTNIREYPLDVQPLNTSVSDGRPFRWKNQHPNQSVKIKARDIFEISQKSVFEISPKEISPIPHDTRRLPLRRRGQTAVAITDSPYKRHLESISAIKRKFDRSCPSGTTTKKRLGNVPNVKEKWSGKEIVTGDTSDEYEDGGSDSRCI
jgi:hypothetical protein